MNNRQINGYFYLVLLLMMVGFSSYQSNAQNTLYGKIVDIESGEGIGFASITSSAKNGVLSDSLGNFVITSDKFPVILNISHISYGNFAFKIIKNENKLIVFSLKRNITVIREIVISGKKLNNITAHEDFSVMKFEFDYFYMWMIGLKNNTVNNTRLYLATLTGDTITSVPIKSKALLGKDLFGNVHLQVNDSIFQLTAIDNVIKQLYGERIDQYLKITRGYQAVLSKGLVFYNYNRESDVGQLFYIDSTMNHSEVILRLDKEPEDLSWLPSGMKRLGDFVGRKTVDLMVSQQRDYMGEVVQSKIFNIADSLCIVDLNNDKLRIISPDKELVRSIPISFNHQPHPTLTNLFINIYSILTDGMLNKAYVVYHINNNWDIKPLNLINGKTGQSLDIPHYNAMTNIRVHSGSIYFIYPEKRYPYFYRVYRQRL